MQKEADAKNVSPFHIKAKVGAVAPTLGLNS